MTLCEVCAPIGNWLLQDFDPDGTRFVFDVYHHHKTWTDLQKSVQDGCKLCHQISTYFHTRGSHHGWYEREILPSLDESTQPWMDQITELDQAGEDTEILILNGLTPEGIPTLGLRCGDVGYRDKGLTPYLTNDDPGVYPVTHVRPRKKHVQSDPLSLGTIDLVKTWINDCNNGHDSCGPPNYSFTPMRVVDVTEEGKDPFLAETNGGKEFAKYIALSHCWGKTKQVLTKKENLNQHQSCIPFDSLSKTFQHAIRLTRCLGVRYLWIDSLCIIQDSTDDWEVNAAEMGTVYGNSFLTVAAIDASDGSQGFLNPRQPPVAIPYHINHPQRGKLEGQIWVDAWAPDWNDAVNESIISTRAWVTQERYLPTRVLHVGKYRLMWECQTLQEVECDPESTTLVQEQDDSDRIKVAQLTKLSSGTSRNIEELNSIYSIWHMLVQEYSRKNITFIQDRLPAMAGLAKSFQVALADKYSAGLWKGDFPYALCWEPLLPQKRPNTYVAPSWSWASFASGVSYPLPIKEHISFINDLEISTQPKSVKNPLGAISKGLLRCSGLIRQASLVTLQDGSAKVFLYNSEFLGVVDLEVEYSYRLQVWCILLLERENYRNNKREPGNKKLDRITSVMLLTPVDGEVDTYRRIGIVNRAEYMEDWKTIERKTVTIV